MSKARAASVQKATIASAESTPWLAISPSRPGRPGAAPTICGSTSKATAPSNATGAPTKTAGDSRARRMLSSPPAENTVTPTATCAQGMPSGDPDASRLV